MAETLNLLRRSEFDLSKELKELINDKTELNCRDIVFLAKSRRLSVKDTLKEVAEVLTNYIHAEEKRINDILLH